VDRRRLEGAALALGAALTVGMLAALAMGAGDAARDLGDILPPLFETLALTTWALTLAFAVGVPAAVWMEFHPLSGFLLGTLTDALGSLPSILAGLFGLAAFADGLHLGFSLLTATLTLSLLNLPFVVRSAQAALRGGEAWVRAAMALGADPMLAFWKISWPVVKRGLVGPALEAAARTCGETAALYVTLGVATGGFTLDPLASRATLSLRLFYLLVQGRTGLQGLTSFVAFSMIAVGVLLHLAAHQRTARRPAPIGRQD